MRDSILRLVWLDGWMENIRSVLDLEVKGVEFSSHFFDGASDVLLTNEGERTILWGTRGVSEWGEDGTRRDCSQDRR